MMALGLLIMIPGVLLLTGEYLCVEVAWRCLNYNEWYVSLGGLLFGTGFIAILMGANHD